ncbi:HNH endonuclease [Streptomyces sp. NPDC058257]|uniref:HNH endonuclease n=1 Tax=Streptomyces sp. NPDC058257 TaxID=3346409 RepID=UPI0036E1B84A
MPHRWSHRAPATKSPGHRQPLALEGEDTDTNVQPLCHNCHLAKTAEDFTAM